LKNCEQLLIIARECAELRKYVKKCGNLKIMKKHTIFHTSLGYFAIISTDKGIIRTILPVKNRQKCIDILFKSGGKTSVQDDKYFEKTTHLIQAYYGGESVNFSDVKVDLTGKTDFAKTVLNTLRTVSYGQTITYSRLAELSSRKSAARAVGTVLANNPIPLIIPCHRVIRTDGKIGNFSAEGGTKTKKRMLELEKAVKFQV
jgi:methylated-DNA-[protein]-cysteine S-methyltransferase